MSRGWTQCSIKDWKVIFTSALSHFCQTPWDFVAAAVIPWRLLLKLTSWMFCHHVNPNTFWPKHIDRAPSSWQQTENHRQKLQSKRFPGNEILVGNRSRLVVFLLLKSPKMLACLSGSACCLIPMKLVNLGLSFLAVTLLSACCFPVAAHVRWNTVVQGSLLTAAEAGRSFLYCLSSSRTIQTVWELFISRCASTLLKKEEKKKKMKKIQRMSSCIKKIFTLDPVSCFTSTVTPVYHSLYAVVSICVQYVYIKHITQKLITKGKKMFVSVNLTVTLCPDVL